LRSGEGAEIAYGIRHTAIARKRAQAPLCLAGKNRGDQFVVSAHGKSSKTKTPGNESTGVLLHVPEGIQPSEKIERLWQTNNRAITIRRTRRLG
jgi:hypothetical protein